MLRTESVLEWCMSVKLDLCPIFSADLCHPGGQSFAPRCAKCKTLAAVCVGFWSDPERDGGGTQLHMWSREHDHKVHRVRANFKQQSFHGWSQETDLKICYWAGARRNIYSELGWQSDLVNGITEFLCHLNALKYKIKCLKYSCFCRKKGSVPFIFLYVHHSSSKS